MRRTASVGSFFDGNLYKTWRLVGSRAETPRYCYNFLKIDFGVQSTSESM
jgi:hypothetical protein